MSQMVVMPRSVYEVRSKIKDSIRLYLDTGVQKHLNENDVIILIGETACRVGLDREMHRDRVSFREFNVVEPTTEDPKVKKSEDFQRALKQYERVMNHLFSGNVMYLVNGEIRDESTAPALPEPPAPPEEDETPPAPVVEEDVKVDDTEQVEKLEEAVSQPELKIVKGEEESPAAEIDIEIDDEVIDEDPVTEEDKKDENKSKGKSPKKGRSRKKSKK